MIQHPAEGEYPMIQYFSNYIDLVADEQDVFEVLKRQCDQIVRLYETLILPEQAEFRYAEGKWSLKEMLGHMVDTERVFAYRAMCIARGEKQSLPGFDENGYMASAEFAYWSLADLLDYYQFTRKSNIIMFHNLSEKAQQRIGNANGHPVSARAMVWVLAGHEKHHLRILKDRYGLY
ncbi:MAG: DinB family protein [Siphonobacter sp.]